MSLFGIFVVVGGGEIDARTSLKRGEKGGGDAGTDPSGHSVELLIGQTGALILHGYDGFLFLLLLACLGSSVETHTKSANTMEEGSNRNTISSFFFF